MVKATDVLLVGGVIAGAFLILSKVGELVQGQRAAVLAGEPDILMPTITAFEEFGTSGNIFFDAGVHLRNFFDNLFGGQIPITPIGLEEHQFLVPEPSPLLPLLPEPSPLVLPEDIFTPFIVHDVFTPGQVELLPPAPTPIAPIPATIQVQSPIPLYVEELGIDINTLENWRLTIPENIRSVDAHPTQVLIRIGSGSQDWLLTDLSAAIRKGYPNPYE